MSIQRLCVVCQRPLPSGKGRRKYCSKICWTIESDTVYTETKEKKCHNCGVTKSVDEFSDNKIAFGGRRYNCKPCQYQIDKSNYDRRMQNPVYREQEQIKDRQRYPKRRDAYIKCVHGLTAEDYGILLKACGGVCEICKSPPGKYKLCIDHDHTTGEIRGLLCINCNTALGLLKDDDMLMISAALYLRSKRKE